MGCHCLAVLFEAAGGGADALGDVEDDACEAIFVDVDFLVVWDLAEGAGGVSMGGRACNCLFRT